MGGASATDAMGLAMTTDKAPDTAASKVTAVTTNRFRCDQDRSGSGLVRRVWAVDATNTHEDVAIWIHAAHIDGPMSADAESLWTALCQWTGYVDDGT